MQCQYSLKEEKLFEWTNCLFQNIHPKEFWNFVLVSSFLNKCIRVLVIDWTWKPNYISSSEGPSLRRLITDSSKEIHIGLDIPFLETANVLDTEPSAVLTHVNSFFTFSSTITYFFLFLPPVSSPSDSLCLVRCGVPIDSDLRQVLVSLTCCHKAIARKWRRGRGR